MSDTYHNYCGTKEDWEYQKEKFPDAKKLEPVEVYVSKKGLFLVTSRDGVNYLITLSRELNGEID